MVPIAPSATTTLSRKAIRNELGTLDFDALIGGSLS